jgi:HK97 family phage major capsid protein
MNRRLKALQDQKRETLAANRKILDAAKDRELTEDEQKTIAANAETAKGLDAKIDAENQRAEWERTCAALPSDTEEVGTKVGNATPTFESDPQKGFKTPREFFAGVMQASIDGRIDDPRLKHLSSRVGAAAGSDEHGSYSDPYGGFLVPAGFLPNLLAVTAEADPTAGRTTVIPMTAPKIAIPARTDKDHTSSVSGGLVCYRRSETQAVTASRMTIEQVELTATPLMGLSYATEELLTDSVISFAALIEAGFRDEFAAKILNEKINGTGAGQFEGVINAPATVSVAKETGQDADSIVYENLVNMRARCWRYQDAIWLYNHDCLPQLMQLVQVIGTAGVPVWMPSAREDAPDMILGRPAFATEFCPTVGDTGDIILGNWSQYLEGTYQPLQSAESMHVRFEYNERTFRFLMRNDGRCWWRSALTPKKSTATLSPFVKLNARA